MRRKASPSASTRTPHDGAAQAKVKPTQRAADQRQHDKSAQNKTGRRQRPAQGPGFDEFSVDKAAAEDDERQRCRYAERIAMGPSAGAFTPAGRSASRA